MIKNTLILFLFLISINIQAQAYFTSKVLLLNGETIEGSTTLPKNKITETSIKVKYTGSKIATSIKSDDIYQILYTINGNKYFFERNNMGITTKPFKKQRTSTYFGKEWFMVIFSNTLIKVYISTQSYYVNIKGELATHSYEGRNIVFGTSYLLKKTNKIAPTVISMHDLSNSKFRKWASLYFRKNPALVERIKNKEFKKFQVDLLAQAYTSYQ
ncbi:hypothetical protein [Lacinutrix sp. Bg11-31]|uniref:hypothetical protein n=1 Tax=Lacinutrix sp. Bg11-31 TaxID=2057808 RepID=UPI000C31B145|nr:hypothetical protein [Lacinutrix sp. Bg11-31]AUC83600.1 hypothetical protein CW733_16280 [Lacinutrix sp. Bg11-31]